eukprot:3916896-Amphidinium_carterae.1
MGNNTPIEKALETSALHNGLNPGSGLGSFGKLSVSNEIHAGMRRRIATESTGSACNIQTLAVLAPPPV